MKRCAALILIFSPLLIAKKTYHVPVRQSQLGALNLAVQTTHNRVIELHEKLDAHTVTLESSLLADNAPVIGQPITQQDVPYTIDQPGSYYLTESVTIASNQDGITITADNVVFDLQGHTISGAAQNNASGGIAVENVIDLTIQNGTIQNMNKSGISITNSSHIRLHSILSRSNNQHGVFVQDGSVVAIERTYATNNALDGFNVAADHITYTTCFAIENTGSGFFHSGNNLSVALCHAHANGMNGFMCSNSTNIHMSESKAYMNTFKGFQIISSNEFHLEQLLFMNNGTHGVSMESSQNGSLSDCTIKKNQQHGIYSVGTDSVLIMESDLSNNLQSGVHVASGSYWTLQRNAIQANLQSGVRIFSTHSLIEGNTIAHNGIGAVDEYGIDIGLNATTNEIFGNRAKHNGVSPGLPVATDTNFSAGVYQSPVSSPIGSQVSPGGGIGVLENISTT